MGVTRIDSTMILEKGASKTLCASNQIRGIGDNIRRGILMNRNTLMSSQGSKIALNTSKGSMRSKGEVIAPSR